MRKFEPSDVDGLFKVLSDEDVMRYIEPPFSLKQTEEFVHKYGICDNPKVFALIYDKSKSSNESAELIGHVIFHPFRDEILEAKYGAVYELGFVIAKEFWGKGIAGEITEVLISIAKENEIGVLVIECDKDNAASIRIARKYGFVPYESASSTDDSLISFILPL